MLDKGYLKRKLKRVSAQIDALQKKASKQHLGGQGGTNLMKLIKDQTSVIRQMKRERFNGKTKTQ